MQAVADTHALIWYLFDDSRLSRTAKQFIDDAAREGEQIGFSAISVVEIVYLMEKQKIKPDALERLLKETQSGDTALIEVPVTGNVARTMQSISRETIPDMPDRIIAATALELNIPIISRDGKIKVSELKTIW